MIFLCKKATILALLGTAQLVHVEKEESWSPGSTEGGEKQAL